MTRAEEVTQPSRSEAPIEIVPYDATWPAKFEHERTALEQKLAPWLVGRVEHVGSTAIPGLAAKPIIDVMAPVSSLSGSTSIIEAAVRLGYIHYPYKPDVMHWFCKPSPDVRTHHLHVVPVGSDLWNERIAFRDALRTHPELLSEYQDLKLRLAERFRHDREAYTESKGPFVQRVLRLVHGATPGAA